MSNNTIEPKDLLTCCICKKQEPNTEDNNRNCFECGEHICDQFPHWDNCKECDETFCLNCFQGWGHVTMCTKCGNAYYGVGEHFDE